MKLEEALKRIEPVNEEVMEESKKRWDSIAHPLHSLGKLEDLLVQITGITGCLDIHLEKKALVPMCAERRGRGGCDPDRAGDHSSGGREFPADKSCLQHHV